MQNKQVGLGELLSGAFEELSASRRAVGLYFLIFLFAGFVAQISGPLSGVVSLITGLGYFAAQYYLYRTILIRAGIVPDEKIKVFSFFFMAVVLGFPIYFGMTFLLVPGALLAAKWVMAPSYLVAERTTLFEAIGASWHASSNNLLSLTLAFSVIFGIWLVLLVVFGGAVSAGFGSISLQGPSISAAVVSMAIHLLPVMLMGLSITAYRRLSDQEGSLAGVFE